MATAEATYDVGGIRLARPFRVLRLGHFGFNVEDQEKALRFYSDLLGLPMTDTVDFGQQFKVASPEGKDPNGYFLRVGADHHSVVLFPRWAFAAANAPKAPGTEWISHMAWQVATLREVTEGRRWLTEQQVRIARPGGRDGRGANWNFTVTDADAISNEIYYGMDQIGWDGVSKPVPICPNGDPLPPIDGAADPDFPMARGAIEGGLDLRQGLHQRPFGEPRYDVAGVRLARPFRIVRNGPIRLFAHDLDAAARFYAETMGLALTEEITWQGHRALFFRCNTEHHTIALYPMALRQTLGLRPDSLCMAYGMQVGSLSPVEGRGRVSRRAGRHDQIPAARTLPRPRLFGLRLRSRGPRDPALLLYGADRLGRPPAPRRGAAQDRQRPLARGAAAALRHLLRPGLSGPARVAHSHLHGRMAPSERQLPGGGSGPVATVGPNAGNPFMKVSAPTGGALPPKV